MDIALNSSSNKPFIKVIRTSKETYVYDVNSNHILRISEKVGRILENWDFESKLIQNENIVKFIYRVQEENKLLQSHRPKKAIPSLIIDDLNGKDLSTFSQIILNITDSCNMRCKYCIYSGSYEGRRKHSSKNMSWHTARNAINLLARCSKDSDEMLILGFYGGEPLLRFDFICRCVEYANLLFGDHPHSFAITTNGTLLTETIIDYLVANKFVITISIDGPKEIHDKNRRFINDSGTFEDVSKNLEKLRIRCGDDYFRDFVSLSAVLTPPYDFLLLNDFFTKFHTSLRLSTQEYRSDLYPDTGTHQARGWENLAKTMKDYCLNRNEKDDFRLEGLNMPYDLFGRALKKIHNRPFDQPIGDSQRVLGLCQPGKARAFVSSDGNIYICEKVDGNKNALIGTVENGINADSILKIVENVSQLDFSQCNDCWVMRFCNVCFAHILSGNPAEKWKLSCDGLRNSYEAALKLYCEIMEEDERALDFFLPK